MPIALFRRINIRIIVCLYDVLQMTRSLEEILTARETLIFLLLNLGFVMNVKRSIHQPVKQMTLSLLKEKPNYIIQQYLHVYSKSKTSVLNLTKLIGLLSSIVLAIFFQQEQILGLKSQGRNSFGG